MKKLYSVEIDISLACNNFTCYVDVKANNAKEAYQEALKLVNTTLDVRVEKKPLEALIQDDFEKEV